MDKKVFDLQFDHLNAEYTKAHKLHEESTKNLEQALTHFDEKLFEDCLNSCVLAYEFMMEKYVDMFIYQYRNAAQVRSEGNSGS